MPLFAIGPGIDCLKDYTNNVDYTSASIKAAQGDTLDEADFTVWDPLSTFPLASEDDCIILDETDPNGWPTVQLLYNPSFNSPYTSGVADGWNKFDWGSGYSGVTYTSSSTVFSGTTSQKIIFSGVAGGDFYDIYQFQMLPQDIDGNPMVDVPYTFSAYVMLDAGFAGTSAGAYLEMDWHDANGSTISQPWTGALTIDAGQVDVWRRLSFTQTPPANAYSVSVRVGVATGSGLSSANARIDCAQLERATFQTVALGNPTPPLQNTYMSDHSASHFVVDCWRGLINSSAVGSAIYDTVTTPVINGNRSQRITLSNYFVPSYSGSGMMMRGVQPVVFAGSGNAAIFQGYDIPITINPLMAYTLRITYKVTTSLVNARVYGSVAFLDGSYSTISSVIGQNAIGEASGLDWRQVSIAIGPGQANAIPTTTQRVAIFAGLNTTAATNSGAIVIGQITLTPLPLSQQWYGAQCYLLAKNAGVYPTPYCNTGVTGCYFDDDTACAYRQLRLFGGYVRSCNRKYLGGYERTFAVKAADYGILLQEAPANLIIRATADYLAIKAAGDYASGQGYIIGVDYQTYVDYVSNVDAMTFNWTTMKDVLSKIANNTVSAFYVDYYKRLHFTPALAVSAPFAISDHPDYINTFPFEEFEYDDDSTQSRTEQTIEGSTQLSAPISFTLTGTGAQTVFTLNGGDAINQIDDLFVGAAQKIVGLYSVDAYASGYDALLDPNTGKVYFQVAPGNGVAITGHIRVHGPVTVRVHASSSSSKTTRVGKRRGKVRRKVHHKVKKKHVDSKQSAIDEANSQLSQYSQPQPIGKAVIRTPPCPASSQIRVGQAIAITHAPSGFVGQLFQIVEMTTYFFANGMIRRELGIGVYRPDFMIHMVHTRRHHNNIEPTLKATNIINDILAASDGWTLTDSVTATTTNTGRYGTATYDGGAAYG